MDLTEDISVRALLKDILSTEPPRTPVIRSHSQAPGTSGIRRSSRLSRNNAEAQTPQNILRRSLKHKIHESITRKSLPATSKRRTPSVALRKIPSMLVSEEETPRCLLRNILQTEPVKSPVLREKEPPAEPEQRLAERAATKTHSSIELSGLDLPDVTIGNISTHTAKGLSRKRPRRSLNVTAFEKRLKGAGEETESSADDLSSLSSSSSLSLKTPLADVWSEKGGLRRRVSNRRKITEKEFDAAVSKQHMGDVSSRGLAEKNLCEVTNSEGITLGLSNLSEPNVTDDLVHCSTALYDQPDVMTSKLSTLATRYNPMVVLSPLQMDVRETEEEEEKHGTREREQSAEALETVSGPQSEEHVCDPEAQEVVNEPHTEEGHAQLDDAAAVELEEEEDAVGSDIKAGHRTETAEVEAQPEEEGAADSNPEENDRLDDLTAKQLSPDSQREEEEEEEIVENEEERAAGSRSEDVEESSQSEGEEDAQGSQTEEVAASAFSPDEAEARSEEELPPDSHTGEEESEADSQPEEEKGIAGIHDGVSQSEDAEESSQSEGEEGAQGSQTEEEGAADSQTDGVVASSPSQDEDEATSQPTEDAEDVVESQTEEEHKEEEQLDADLELIDRRAHRPEGTFILPAVEARDDWDDVVAPGQSGAKSNMNTTFDLNASAQLGIGEVSQPQTRELDVAEPSVRDQEHTSCAEPNPDVETENSFHLYELTQDTEVSGRESSAPPEHTSAQDSAEQEEEWEDEEAEEAKTPAFVKVKRNFFLADPPGSPVFRKGQASLTSVAVPAAKPKQVRRRKRGTAGKEAVLSKAYLMSVFRHFAKTKVSADVFPVLNDTMDQFFDRLVKDLETYAAHAKRKNIEVEDAKLLLRRQGYVNDKVPVEVLIEKYLRMEQRKLLIPIATSGNVVIPKTGR